MQVAKPLPELIVLGEFVPVGIDATCSGERHRVIDETEDMKSQFWRKIAQKIALEEWVYSSCDKV